MPYKKVWRNGIPMTEYYAAPKPRRRLRDLVLSPKGKPYYSGGTKGIGGKEYSTKFLAGGRTGAQGPLYRTDPLVAALLRKAPLTGDVAKDTAPSAPPAPPAPPGAGGGDGATATGDPWQKYLDDLNNRERAMYAERRKIMDERARNYMEAMSGFGQALQGNAAEQWAKVIQGYGRAGEAATAYGQAFAGDYGQGLHDANRQMAQDFAAIGQEGAPVIRDDAAALQQIATQGGERPGEVAGLVGRAWGSYGETRPGTIALHTMDQVSQIARTALEQGQDLDFEMQKDLADNPAQAQAAWEAIEAKKAATTKAEADQAQQEFDNALKLAADAREEKALQLTISKLQQSGVKDSQSYANALTNQTGKLWVVRNGKLVNTGKAAPGSKAAATTASTKAKAAALAHKQWYDKASLEQRTWYDQASLEERSAHNRTLEDLSNMRIGISQQNANTAARRAAQLAAHRKWQRAHPNAGDNEKGPDGLSNNDIRQWGKRAGELTRYGWNNKMDVNELMRNMIIEKIPYTIAYDAIRAYAKTPGSRWKAAMGWQTKGKYAPKPKKK